jgi:uncharacterized membrane protein YidH (DUF202 family)
MSLILMSLELMLTRQRGAPERGTLAWTITVLALLLGASVAVAGGR